jgi:hypothetical protein
MPKYDDRSRFALAIGRPLIEATFVDVLDVQFKRNGFHFARNPVPYVRYLSTQEVSEKSALTGRETDELLPLILERAGNMLPYAKQSVQLHLSKVALERPKRYVSEKGTPMSRYLVGLRLEALVAPGTVGGLLKYEGNRTRESVNLQSFTLAPMIRLGNLAVHQDHEPQLKNLDLVIFRQNVEATLGSVQAIPEKIRT